MINSQPHYLLERIAEQEKRIAELEARIAKLEGDNLALHKENKELKARLQAYENAHTPPSLSKKKRPPRQSSGKLGAPLGHPKYERSVPEPTKTVEHKAKNCPHCKYKLKKPFRIERRVIEEIPEPQPIEVTEHLIYYYKCSHCDKEVVPKHNLPKGGFGYNLETNVTLLKYDDRLTLIKAAKAIERQYGIRITDVGILKITNRAAKKLAPEYWKQILLLRASKVVYVDETEIKVNGKAYWLWAFVGLQQTIFVIRKSRAKKVIEEILGKNFFGTITCDGWTAYTQYSNNLQRCWAHMLREAKELLEKYKEFEVFYNNLKKMYAQVKRVRAKQPPPKKRLQLKEKLEERMKHMLDAMDSHKHFAKFATKLRNGLPYWFTCIVKLWVEPTNNIAERALRELIVQRKIIGSLRAEQGAETMAIVHSMLATWKQQNQPTFQTLKKHISC